MNILPTDYGTGCLPCSTQAGSPNICPEGEVPGSKGDPGTNGNPGAAGAGAFTTVTTAFTVPAINSSVAVVVGSTAWMAVGQIIFIQSAGSYRVASITDLTDASLTNLGYTGNATAGTVIASANRITAGGLQGPAGAIGSGVTSVALSVPSGFTVSGSPITSAGTIALISDPATTQGKVYASPASATGAATFRALVATDIPALPASKVTSGQIAIANGGTGQSTSQAGFNALSPITTKGDLIGNDGTNDVRVAVGSNGQVLSADSTAASGVAWKSLYAEVTTSTTPYTVLANDQIIGVNVAGVANILLPSAPFNGRIIVVKDESNAAGTNNITVSAGAGDTIEGASTKVISTNSGYLRIYYNATATKWFAIGAA